MAVARLNIHLASIGWSTKVERSKKDGEFNDILLQGPQNRRSGIQARSSCILGNALLILKQLPCTYLIDASLVYCYAQIKSEIRLRRCRCCGQIPGVQPMNRRQKVISIPRIMRLAESEVQPWRRPSAAAAGMSVDSSSTSTLDQLSASRRLRF